MSELPAKYDYILAGGGLSGQMLALELQKFIPEDASVLIVDRNNKNQNDRTWSYWSIDRFWTDNLAVKTWENIHVRADRFDRKINIDPYHYATIRGIDFYNFTKEKLKDDSRFEWIKADISSVDNQSGNVSTLDGKCYEGNLIFKSFFDPKHLSIPSENYTVLYQQFKGWFVKTEEPIFDDSTVTFMDFQTLENTKETRFFYILPFSKNEALVEYTAFTANRLDETVFDQHLDWYFKEKLPATKFEIKETEFDFIPMTDYPFPGKVEGKVVNIGTTAAFVKASTGYCFSRTREKVQLIANALQKNGKIEESDFTSPVHYRIFDSAMLDMTGSGKIPGAKFFTSLFKKMPSSFLFRFLDEKASFGEIIRTMLSSPGKIKLIRSTMNKLLKINRL